ncbi:MAG: Hsp20/alpha crystallin family protein [Candidatus Moduliflexus flocculans]|nr:Hsp20/alpha crystallin family protein [Candidatus Moduliflexus flocculans]
MVRRIKPVSRPRKAETRVRTTARARPAARAAACPSPARSPCRRSTSTRPATDYIVEIELPGVEDKDVKVLLFSSRIEVSGFKRELGAPTGSRYTRLEREFGTFRRDVVVPGAVDPDRACAALENGVLTVVLKKPPRKRRDVDIKTRREGG